MPFTLLAALHLTLAPPYPVPCRAKIEARCRVLRGDEALLCRNEADAQCDIAEAEQFIAAGDGINAESRVDQACDKYEDQLNMLAPEDTEVVAAAMIRYAAVTQSIFALLAREGEVEDLTRAVVRLDRSRGFLIDLLGRVPALTGHTGLATALELVSTRLATAHGQLGRLQMQRGDAYFKDRGSDGDGGADTYYERAAVSFHAAYALAPKILAYNIEEYEARLARADLHAALSRTAKDQRPLACTRYNAIKHDLQVFQRSFPGSWRQSMELHDYLKRAERGSRVCTADPRIRAGAALVGVGATSLIVAFGLYAHYNSVCDFDATARVCRGIVAGTSDATRYTAQVPVVIGLAAVGGAVLAAGTTVMIQGLVQRRRARPQRLSVHPALGPGYFGSGFNLRF